MLIPMNTNIVAATYNLHSVHLPPPPHAPHPPTPLCEGGIFLPICLKNGERSKNISRGVRKKGGDIFFLHYFGGGNWDFHDPKINICKINYCEKKAKLIKVKDNVNEIKEIKSLSISYSLSLNFKNFWQLALTYSNSRIKTYDKGVQYV